MDALSTGISGLGAAGVRLRNSAHNVANFSTPEFRSHRTDLSARRGGGVEASTRVDAEPAPVDLAGEFVEQSLAKLQFESSLRVIGTDLELKGRMLDVLA